MATVARPQAGNFPEKTNNNLFFPTPFWISRQAESAEAQLEKREAERKAVSTDATGDEPQVVHTPLMDFLREKRAK